MSANSGQVDIKITISSTPTSIPNLLDHSGPSLSAETVDATDADSTSDWEQHIPVRKVGGDVQFSMNYDPDNSVHQYLHDNVGVAGQTLTITHADATFFTVSGTITAFEPSGAHNDKLVVSCTFKVTGSPTMP